MYPKSCVATDNQESQVHELPSEPLSGPVVAELHEVSLVELPIPQSDESSICTGQMEPEYPSHDHGSAVERTTPQQLGNAEASRLPLYLNTQRYSVPDPGTISCQQSHNSSPISSDTPDTNASYDTQFQYGIQFQESMRLSHEVHSLLQDPQATSNMSQPGFASQDGYVLSSNVSPVEQPLHSPLGSHTGYPTIHSGSHAVYPSSIYSSGSETCIASSNISFVMGSPIKQSVSSMHGGSSTSPGGYDCHEPRRWEHHPEGDLKTSNAKFAHHSTMRASPSHHSFQLDQSKSLWQLPCTYAELEDHQFPEVISDSEIREEVDTGTISCGKCDTVFRGKYRKGNLKRHDLAFHNPLASAVGKACRVCKKAFKRADATKKHEWKKHRLLDAKPKKRNTSQDWTQFV